MFFLRQLSLLNFCCIFESLELINSLEKFQLHWFRCQRYRDEVRLSVDEATSWLHTPAQKYISERHPTRELSMNYIIILQVDKDDAKYFI